MGFLGGLFGKKGGAPEVKMPVYDAAGVGLNDMKKGVAKSVNQQRGISDYFGSMIPGLLGEFDKQPTLTAADQSELDNYSSVFSKQLRDAQLNSLNVAGNQIGGAMSALAGKGMSTMGAGAANIKAGILAGQQNTLNQAASQQAMGMMELRNNLLAQVQDRMMSKVSFISSQQAQADSQSANNLGTLLGDNAAQMKLEADISSYNAQLSQANKASKRAMAGGMFSSVMGLLGGGMSAFGGGR